MIVLALDPEGRILRFNDYMEELTGYKLDEARGRDWFEMFIPPGERPRIRQLFAVAARGTPTRGNVNPIITRSGEQRMVEWHDAPLVDERGRMIGLLCCGQDITDRVAAERDLQGAYASLEKRIDERTRAMREALAQHKAILASTLDPVVTIDSRGVVQSASDSVERVFGWAPDELVGENISVLMPEPHRSMHDQYLANYRRTNETHILGRTREFEAVRKNGPHFPIELSVSRADIPGQPDPIFIGILRDISERKRTERELRLLQSITQAIAEATDLKSAMVTALYEICDATGWDYGEAWLPDPETGRLVDTPVWHVESDALDDVADFAHGISFGPGEGAVGRVWSTGRTEWLSNLLEPGTFWRADQAERAGMKVGVGIPVLSGDKVVAVLLFLMRNHRDRDDRLLELVTAALAGLGAVVERKRAEDELAQYRDRLEELVAERTEDLRASHEQLRQVDRLASIGTLAAGLGHDMNNVLLPIRSRLDVIEAGDLPKVAREQFDAIRTSIGYLQHLADGLHLLAKDPEDADASDASTNIPAWWRQVEPLLARGLPRHVKLETDWTDDLPSVAVEPHRLTQAMLNLIVNAGEAVGQDGVVRVAARSDEPGSVRLSVIDNGEGMPEKVRRRALDPFFTTKKRGLGTGLGLSLVNGVVSGAGGRMEIASTPGEGSTITLALPAATARLAETDGVAVLAAISVDDPRIASLLATLLDGAGAEVVRDSDVDPASCDIWFLEPRESRLSDAQTLLKKPGGRIVVIGEPTANWHGPRIEIVENPRSYESLSAAVASAIRAFLETSR